MFRALRIALMWLMAVAVPVQGAVAATMFVCGPGHHGSALAAEAASHRRAAAEMRDHADAHASHHDASHAHGDLQKPGKGACSPCASCCVGTGLPATVSTFEAVALAEVFMRAAPQSAAPFLTEGLERPPRFFSAR
jgi:hypothetical protein